MASEVDAAGAVDEDVLFDALAHRRRRLILAVLLDAEPPLSLTELARAIARRESAGEEGGTGNGRADHVAIHDRHGDLADQLTITLHHRHAPILDDAGLVDYDESERMIDLTVLPPAVEAIVEQFSR